MLTRGCDSFSKNATKASVRLRLLLELSLGDLENHPPSATFPLLKPILVHSASFKFKTFEMSLRI